jgi:hypothetical protein
MGVTDHNELLLDLGRPFWGWDMKQVLQDKHIPLDRETYVLSRGEGMPVDRFGHLHVISAMSQR